MERRRMTLAICNPLLGTIFGRFYKVMVLVPAAALLFAVVCANFTILEFAVLSTCLLAGYASGLLFFIPEIRRRHKNLREPSRPPAPSGGAAPGARACAITVFDPRSI